MKERQSTETIRVGLVSLGCAKNLVDAEIMLGTLLKAGIELTNDPAKADVVIINTCSFIDAAQEESVDAILESAELREANNRGQGLIVSGCLPQRFREELPKLLPEVDAFMGIDQVADVPAIVRAALARRAANSGTNGVQKKKSARRGVKWQIAALDPNALSETDGAGNLRGTAAFGRTKTILNGKAQPAQTASLVNVNARPSYIPDYATPRFRLTPKHSAYVKIAEGCNHPCSFCIIPQMRGSHRSRQQSDIVAEARALLAEGVKELNLISQDSTYYGLDLRPNHSRAIAAPEKFGAAVKALPAQSSTICSLLRELNSLPGDFWVRLLYTHPAHWTDELIRTIAECPKVARYVDIPLQHIHENMLERMRRETSRQYIVELLGRIRQGVPGIALRTSFIVGFPGETEECFNSLLEFIRETRFERLGVFTYSQESGTRAGKMGAQVPDGLKQERRERAMAAQRDVAKAISASFVGRQLKVLVEKAATARELAKARVQSWEHGLLRDHGAPRQAVTPPKNCYVARTEADAPDIDGLVYVRGAVTPGEFAAVRVIGHTDYDLLAEA